MIHVRRARLLQSLQPDGRAEEHRWGSACAYGGRLRQLLLEHRLLAGRPGPD
jgi:hypothetical protein